jgi:hypothetical protein
MTKEQKATISEVSSKLETVRDEIQDKLDDLPESQAESDKATEMSDDIEGLDIVISVLEDLK